MQLEAWVPTEPGLDARMLMCTVIVYDQMELQRERGLGIDFLEKSNELLVSMPRHAVAYDFSIEHAQSGE